MLFWNCDRGCRCRRKAVVSISYLEKTILRFSVADYTVICKSVGHIATFLVLKS